MPLKKTPRIKKAKEEAVVKTHEEIQREIVELQAKIDALNPHCGRGGCLHHRLDHVLNFDTNKYECHKCSCADFTE